MDKGLIEKAACSQVPSPSSAVHAFANAKLEFIWVLLIAQAFKLRYVELEFIWVLLIAQAFKPGYGWTIRLGL